VFGDPRGESVRNRALAEAMRAGLVEERNDGYSGIDSASLPMIIPLCWLKA
jgi:hypothetical protein